MKRRYDALLAIAAYIEEHGWPPSLAEIGAAIGLRSRARVLDHLLDLEAEGMIRRGPGPRMLRLTEIGREFAWREREAWRKREDGGP